MKKYILGMTVISMLSMVNPGMAMDKKGMPANTSLSAQEVTELRKAVKNYKNDQSRSKQERIIKQYQNKYPNDPFVQSKMKEKMKFDGTMQPQIKKESIKGEMEVKTSLSSKQQAELREAVRGVANKPLTESRQEQLIINEYGNKYYKGSKNDDPFVKAQVEEASRIYKLKKQAPVREEKKQVLVAEEKKVKTSLSSKQQAELREAVRGVTNKPLTESRQEQRIISEYGNKYYNGSKNDDPFVKAQVQEASRIYKLKKHGPDYREID